MNTKIDKIYNAEMEEAWKTYQECREEYYRLHNILVDFYYLEKGSVITTAGIPCTCTICLEQTKEKPYGPQPLQCLHNWVLYQGLVEVYNYCEKCGEKK